MILEIASYTKNFSLLTGKQLEEQALLKEDRKFSAHCVSSGFLKAFSLFADNNVMILGNSAGSVKGKKAIRNCLKNREESLSLEWFPLNAEVSESGDLGYTIGEWKKTDKNGTSSGVYVSIWKKNKNDKWKFILDSGISGPFSCFN